MTQNGQIEIPLSKKKMTLILLGSIVFVGLGIWFIINPSKISNPIFSNSTLISIVGFVSILFFGLIAVLIFRKLSDKNAGLIINHQGIIDNSSGISAGLVLWTDIEEIRTIQVANQKFLMFVVKNPQEYINKITNPIKRKGMEMNYKNYGSPINISANSLQINFDELYSLLTKKLKEHKF